MNATTALPLQATRLALILLVLALILLPLVALAQDVGQVPTPPPLAPAPTVAPAAGGWLSPQGLETIFLIVVCGLMPAVAWVARRAGFNRAADTITAAQADASAARGALTTLVKGVERARKQTSFAIGKDIALAIQDVAQADGTQSVLDAVVQAVTKPGSTPPTGTPKAGTDPVAEVIRRATGRLDGGRAA
jgi:hypothetical protein